MSHEIELPIDAVLSTQGTEWHGLATQVEVIDRATVAPLLFPIRTGNLTVNIDGHAVPMNFHKPLVADLRECRPDLLNEDGTPGENSLVPLHIPKNSYGIVENGALWDVMEEAFKTAGIDANVSTAGTLGAAKKFFITVALRGEEGFKVNGDDYLAYLNFITSHDGTLGVKAYDSTVRIVCANTLRASLSAAGDVGFTVYHTAGADTAMKNLPALVAEILSGRAAFKTNMEYLASLPCDGKSALEIALGYFVKSTGEKELAKRSFNAAEEIATLFSRGKGNNGRTLYDLLNGATEYWTSGDGTGKKASRLAKLSKANFGTAADHKDAFSNFLLNPDTVEEMIEAGRNAQSIALRTA